MSLEQNLSNKNETQEVIKNNQEVEPVAVPNAEELKAKEDAKVERKIEDEKKIDEIRNGLVGNNESKEGYPEGHILNPNMLDKIAQLEAISHDTFEFIQDRYDKYIEDEKNGRHRGYSVTGNQEKIKKLLKEGEELSDALYEADIIYGEGGWNRYNVDYDTGMVKLNSGSSATNTTGSKNYFEVLRNKAKELGMEI